MFFFCQESQIIESNLTGVNIVCQSGSWLHNFFSPTGMTKQSYIEAVLAAIEEAKNTAPDITVR